MFGTNGPDGSSCYAAHSELLFSNNDFVFDIGRSSSIGGRLTHAFTEENKNYAWRSNNSGGYRTLVENCIFFLNSSFTQTNFVPITWLFTRTFNKTRPFPNLKVISGEFDKVPRRNSLLQIIFLNAVQRYSGVGIITVLAARLVSSRSSCSVHL